MSVQNSDPKDEFNLDDYLDENSQMNEDVRSSIGTMERTGERKWVYPKKPKGKFTNYRTYVSYVLLAILILAPFFKLPNGNPLFKFDVLHSQFILFGFPFFTSDFFLLALGMITTIIFIVLFTMAYGRLFCGWVCPQTIFLEMVFRKIEYAIEGDRAKQIRLDKQDWDEEKIRKKLLKWTIFAIISFIIANVFLAYIIGADALYAVIKEGPAENVGTLVGLVFFSAMFYFVFAWFREQACTLVCPYGRFQGVLIDSHTINVTYDFKRGEGTAGRAKFKKNEDRKAKGKGDCIDCGQCVVVCPTGIDIRNGIQLECVNCTACIDACDEVMEKVGLPTGLIRYASEDDIKRGEKFKFTKRLAAYTFALLLLIGAMTAFLFSRSDVESKYLKVPGTDYKVEGKYYVNQFEYTLYNKTNADQIVTVQLLSHKNSKVEMYEGENKLNMEKGQIIQGKFFLKIPMDEVKSYKEKVVIGLVNQKGKVIDKYETSFSAPFKY
ncbi:MULTISPECIES: cytochrome c oxidase accessory protein CcoG [Empedobacter]|uniref:cytochrome c oxidase accessory protein CcoG n=1 Tax=Empedobacter TaxID=59734 RepID=UPI001C8F1840|nr:MULTISPECIES: cytochrome c oxidase accessory protein CcoG [Empedobacter]MBY0065902.1 cytochrome c oxidase accessory protein CcoG [Empedobacter falsenii]MDM1138226.1 cytochrome c oxidase accessory protein CcoG [Empedobacter sp. R132-2]